MSYTFNGTPGPWTIGDENNSFCEVMIGDTPCGLQRHSKWIDTHLIEREEMLSNAYLISAAPDLLQAIIHAMERIDIWGPKQFGLVPADPLATLVELQIIVTRFRKAIHKALNIQPHETPLSNP